MQHYFGLLTIVLLIIMVIFRVSSLRKNGISAMLFGKIDKKDFLIPPFALFYFYKLIAGTFNLPAIGKHQLFNSEIAGWFGVIMCLIGLILFFLSIKSFGPSFRVGIDTEHPDQLITTGVFAISRNPIYVGFWIVLLGQFLIFPNWILLIYLGAATFLFHRQTLLEEKFLLDYYGQEYQDYCDQVKRYL